MITESVNNQIKDAMRAKDQASLAVLRSLKAAFTNASQQAGRVSTDVPDTEALAIVRKQIRQREDSIEAFLKAQRYDLAATERDEIRLLSTFLPAEMDQIELDSIVDSAINELQATTKKEMKAVIALVVEKTKGAVDNARISKTIALKLK